MRAMSCHSAYFVTAEDGGRRYQMDHNGGQNFVIQYYNLANMKHGVRPAP